MKFNTLPLLLLVALAPVNGNAEEQQLHSESCGASALSHLITEYTDHQPVSEQEISKDIRELSGNEDEYNFKELELVAKKLGFAVITPKVSIEKLPAFDFPVIVLINLNKGFNHFVVLKGIRPKENGGTAYFFDPATGKNIKMPYKELVERSINNEHTTFSVLGIKGSDEKLKKSTLNLSDDKIERENTHYTEDAAINLTMGNLSKKDQLIVDYGFTTTLGNNKQDILNVRTKNYNHNFSVRYGLDNNTEIGASLQYSDNTETHSIANYKEKINDSNRQYNAYIAKSFSLDEISDRTHLTFQLSGLYAEMSSFWGVGLTVIGVKNTEFAQFSLGGSIGKQFSYDSKARSFLPEVVNYSGFIGANRRLTEISDDLAVSVKLEVSQGENANKNRVGTFERYYSVSTSLPYQVHENFQISPEFAYNFGGSDTFSFGMNIAYIGGW
jgi:predicted double-glycine peptidase